MSSVLSNICYLAINVDAICSRVLTFFLFLVHLNSVLFQSLPLLRTGKTQSVTMSQRQVASLLACEFFCLFPFRSDRRDMNRFGRFPKLNFNRYIYLARSFLSINISSIWRLYQSGPPKNIEKLKCILCYFRRITENSMFLSMSLLCLSTLHFFHLVPTGVITIQRVALPPLLTPEWSHSKKGFCDLHLTTGKRIEEIYNVLQVYRTISVSEESDFLFVRLILPINIS